MPQARIFNYTNMTFNATCENKIPSKISEGALTRYGNYMGVCPSLEFDNIMLSNCLGYDLYILGVFEFLCNSIINL